MKKKLAILLAMLLILCLFPFGSVIAAEQESSRMPNGVLAFSSGLTHVSGSSYRAWASVQAVFDENLSVSFTLYRRNGSTLIYVSSGTASIYGMFIKAQSTVSLIAGTYELHAACSGNTQSDSSTTTYVIN